MPRTMKAPHLQTQPNWRVKSSAQRCRYGMLSSSTSKCDGLRIIVLSCRGGERASVRFLGIMDRAVSAGKFHLHAKGSFRLADKQRPETSGGAAVSLETQGLRDRRTNSYTNAAG